MPVPAALQGRVYWKPPFGNIPEVAVVTEAVEGNTAVAPPEGIRSGLHVIC